MFNIKQTFLRKRDLIWSFIGVILAFFVFCFFTSIEANAQGSSNKGTDFWFLYAPHVNGYSNNAQKMSLYITSDVNTSGQIDIPGINYSTTFTVTANKVTVVTIPQNAYVGGTEGKINKGIHLTSAKPIVAYGHIYNSSMSGATLLLPTNTLGKDYYAISYKQYANSDNAFSFCAIVATEDNTQIIITPNVSTQGGMAAGLAKTITLNKGEIYQFFGKELGKKTSSGNVTTWGDDLTGTTIKSVAADGQSCKKIAVFSGSTRLSIGCLSGSGMAGSADNVFQQVYPTSTWGKSFITVPSKNRNYDVFRIFKSSPSAEVKLNGITINPTSFVNNLYYEFESQSVNYIESDNTIQVVQYQVTQGKGLNCSSVGGDLGDPEMILLNPLEQTLNKMTMYSSPFYAITKHYLNVVIRTADVPSFTLDGANVASLFAPVANKPGYSYAQIDVAEGTHNLQADGGFNAIAYGYGANESYGYAAGASLISPGIEAIDNLTGQKRESGCINEPYNLFVSLPYQPLSLKADFADGNGNVDINLANALKGTEIINGITYYKFQLVTDLIYTLAKKYTVAVLAEKPINDGCGAVDKLELEYEVVEKPVPLFDVSKDKVCDGETFTFTDKSDAKGNTITKWHWDFGDGTKLVKNDATAVDRKYAPGKYTVTLAVENNVGCLSPVFSKLIQVYAPPSAQFKVSSPSCETKAIVFEDISTSVDGNITSWTWDFGDGTTANTAKPNHAYAKAGSYTVKLSVATEYGCQAFVSKQITVNPLPQVDFELPDICLADGMAVFTNKTSIAGGEALGYLWDFGDQNANAQRPNTSTALNGQHVYTQVGTYEVSLTVTSASGCAVTVKKQFRVNGSIPKAGFEVLNSNGLCSGTAVQFKDLASVDFGEVTRIEWFFDSIHKPIPDMVDTDPNLRSANARIYNYTYPAFTDVISRSYWVKMKVYSGGSCVSEVSKQITVYALPTVNFSMPTSCLIDGKANFVNNSTFIDPNAVLTYVWDFGDLNNPNTNSSSDKNPTHQYTASGTYKVTLKVITPAGCELALSKDIVVDGALPQAGFEVSNSTSLCVSSPVEFTDNAKVAFGKITKIVWYFDYANKPNDAVVDDSPADRSNPKKYSYSYPVFNTPFTKSFVVRMLVYSGATCTSTIEKTIEVKAQPLLNFEQAAELCLYAPPVQLKAKEVNDMPGKGQFVGNGVSSDGLFDPSRAGVGTHKITYRFEVTNGCTTEISTDITVNEIPVVDAGADMVILEGGQGTIKASAFGERLTYKWTPAKGLDRDDVLQPTVMPEEDMTYTLTVTSGKGCIAEDKVFVKLLKNLVVPNTITPNNDGINDIWNLKYIDSYPTAKVEIFDRNGQRIFDSVGYTKPFDGTYQGKALPLGTYYYIITLHTKKKPQTGTLTIIR